MAAGARVAGGAACWLVAWWRQPGRFSYVSAAVDSCICNITVAGTAKRGSRVGDDDKIPHLDYPRPFRTASRFAAAEPLRSVGTVEQSL